MQITENGELVVKAPRWLPQFEINRFINSKERWIEKTLGKFAQRSADSIVHTFESGDQFYYLGQLYPLSLSEEYGSRVTFKQGFYTKSASKSEVKSKLVKWYKTKAKELLEIRLMTYAQQNDFSFSKMRISSAKTRWGSCTGKNVVSLNWKLIMMPQEIMDYVIVHELCHTVHHNHSKNFWHLVESITPDWKSKRKWLRENGGKYKI